MYPRQNQHQGDLAPSRLPTQRRFGVMSSDDAPVLSAEQEQALRHETFIAEVLKKRKSPERDEGPKPTWLLFLESAGGVALITVLLGSAGAALLNELVQEELKKRELAAAAYQDRVKQQQQVIIQASELIASSIDTSEDLIQLWAEGFNPLRFSGVQRERIVTYRNGVREKYNTVDSQWRVQSLTVALSVGLLGKAQDNLTKGWRKVQQSVNAYKQCAENWNYNHEQTQEYVTADVARKACDDKKEQITISLDQFAGQAESAWRDASPASQSPR